MSEPTQEARSALVRAAPLAWAAAFGPGLLAMLADTDVGSVVTAAQSGAEWGYRLLIPQFLLIPILYVAQELAARLGLATGRGPARLIAETFGAPLAWLAAFALAVSCFAALVTQIVGLVAVGLLLGAPRGATIAIVTFALLLMVWSNSYRSVERIAIGLGLFELAYLVVAWRSAPDWGQMLAEAAAPPPLKASFIYLVAANIGATVMPWTIFYQQSAVIDKGWRAPDIGKVRFDTLFGAILCQIITAAILVTGAAGLRGSGGIGDVGDIARALSVWLGPFVGRTVFAMGLIGSALSATIVICLALGWTIGDLTGESRRQLAPGGATPRLAIPFSSVLIVGAAIVWLVPDMVGLAIGAAAVNALLLPLVLFILLGLARRALPPAQRMGPIEQAAVSALLAATAAIAFICGVVGFLS
ncbi:MAG TPA: divalent metal cation transporter [Roseiarcus sp.]|nr:divalent metal cation transporter [Roseiarcus sp.]